MSKTIEKIQKEEEAAEKAITKAKEQAKKAVQDLDQSYQDKFAKLSETLGNERKKASDKVQVEVTKLKQGIVNQLKKDLAAISKGAGGKIDEAKNLVIEQFKDYVSQ